MTKQEIKELIYDILENEADIYISPEKKLDYSGIPEPEKMKEFMRLCKADYRNAIYVQKVCDNYNKPHDYYDLLFLPNERGEPVCVPVPLVKKLVGEMYQNQCRGNMTKFEYETIYEKYYLDQKLKDLPF